MIVSQHLGAGSRLGLSTFTMQHIMIPHITADPAQHLERGAVVLPDEEVTGGGTEHPREAVLPCPRANEPRPLRLRHPVCRQAIEHLSAAECGSRYASSAPLVHL